MPHDACFGVLHVRILPAIYCIPHYKSIATQRVIAYMVRLVACVDGIALANRIVSDATSISGRNGVSSGLSLPHRYYTGARSIYIIHSKEGAQRLLHYMSN